MEPARSAGRAGRRPRSRESRRRAGAVTAALVDVNASKTGSAARAGAADSEETTDGSEDGETRSPVRRAAGFPLLPSWRPL